MLRVLLGYAAQQELPTWLLPVAHVIYDPAQLAIQHGPTGQGAHFRMPSVVRLDQTILRVLDAWHLWPSLSWGLALFDR